MKNKLRVTLIMVCMLFYSTSFTIIFWDKAEAGTVTFTLTGAAPVLKKTDSKPFAFYKATYSFSNKDNALTVLPLKTKPSAAINAADGMVNNPLPGNLLIFFWKY